MFNNDVRQIMALSAQADRLGDLLTRKRITEDEYNRKLADLRRHQSHSELMCGKF